MIWRRSGSLELLSSHIAFLDCMERYPTVSVGGLIRMADDPCGHGQLLVFVWWVRGHQQKNTPRTGVQAVHPDFTGRLGARPTRVLYQQAARGGSHYAATVAASSGSWLLIV